MAPDNATQDRKIDPSSYLLNSLIAVVFLAALAIAVAYTVPPEHLVIPQHEVAVRAAW